MAMDSRQVRRVLIEFDDGERQQFEGRGYMSVQDNINYVALPPEAQLTVVLLLEKKGQEDV